VRSLGRAAAALMTAAAVAACGPRSAPPPSDAPCPVRVVAALEGGQTAALTQALASGCSAEDPLPDAVTVTRVATNGVPSLDAVRKAIQLTAVSYSCEGLLGEKSSAGRPSPPAEISAASRPRPLHLAAFHCRPESAAILVRHGGDPNGRDGGGLRPLHYATCPEMVPALLAAGAAVEAPGLRGVHPLHLAVSRGVARALLDAGADIHARDDYGNTPLHIAECLALVRVVVDRSEGRSGLRESGPPRPPTRLDRLWDRLKPLLFRLAEIKASVVRAALRAFDVPGYLRSRGADPKRKNDLGIDADGIALRPGGGDLDVD